MYNPDSIHIGLQSPVDAKQCNYEIETSGYATWFTAGGAMRIAHYDVIVDVITGKL